MILKDCKVLPVEEENTIVVKFPLHHGQQRGDVFLTVENKMEKVNFELHDMLELIFLVVLQVGLVFLSIFHAIDYFVFQDAWLYWMTVASGSLSLSIVGKQNNDSTIGTAFERLVTRIMYVAMCTSDNKDDSVLVGASNPLWRDPILTFSRDGAPQVLTTLSSDGMYREAVKLVKVCSHIEHFIIIE